jgi:hypothetical protein
LEKETGMSLCSAPSLFRAAKGTSPFSLLPLLAGAFVLAAAPRPAHAQDVQSLLQQPGVANMLRSRIQQSGLTAEQIRERLKAAGYSGNLLDAYLDAGATVAPEPGAQVLAAAAALGLSVPTASPLSGEPGFLRRGALPHSRVFGVDALRRTTTQCLPLLAGPGPRDS